MEECAWKEGSQPTCFYIRPLQTDFAWHTSSDILHMADYSMKGIENLDCSLTALCGHHKSADSLQKLIDKSRPVSGKACVAPACP